MTRMPAAELHSNLAQFSGTEQYHRIPGLLLTDGAHYLADKGMALWLMTAIGSYQMERKVKGKPFQVWTLTPLAGNSAVLEMQEDSGTPVLVHQEIEYTDFPFYPQNEPFKLWVVDGVCMLPSEY